MNNLAETIRAACNGDTTAQEKLYLEYAKPVYYLALKLLKNKEEAEDITQDVFIQAFQKLSELQSPEAFPSWLNRIAANKCTDVFRKRMRQTDSNEEALVGLHFSEETDPLLIPEKSFDNAETARMIVEIIDNLPDPQRICVYYYYYEQMTVAQIAENLGTNENTVKTRLSLAREKIRKEIEHLNEKDGIKLYGTVPLMLIPVFKKALEGFEMPPELLSGMFSGVTAQSAANAAGTAAPAAASSAAGGVAGAGKTLGFGAKIAMGIGGIVLIGGLITALILFAGDSEKPYTPTAPSSSVPGETSASPGIDGIDAPEDAGETPPDEQTAGNERCPYDREYINSHMGDYRIVYTVKYYNVITAYSEHHKELVRTTEGFYDGVPDAGSGKLYLKNGEDYDAYTREFSGDGEYKWGTAVPMPGSLVDTLIEYQADLIAHTPYTSFLEWDGDETVAGRECAKYSYTLSDEDRSEIFWIDKETGICLKSSQFLTNNKGDEEGSEYEAIIFETRGITLPSPG